ncbi:TPM domain-containing protein [Phenylobacterium sp. LH3H17]|uniref:TPM domain-containing protein n=1 Tax=Phenylobacterium sp. LH3H17 TaxID=2903901 RepID=UPI0020C97B45|nr:TPM domain-containing protein [Phenylobacterium sp. LH3H17]UTP39189.1 TPM domain-containing protein [Phenylobacterium sp. LH3H17]
MTLMKGPRAFFAVLGALALLVVSAGAVSAAPKFPPLTGRVVDGANLLSPSAEQQLTAELADLEAKTGRQLVVATVPDLQGYEIEDYGYQLLRTWGIGDKARDDGTILVVAPTARKVRIEVGYGLEPVLTDALASLIIQQRILPAFKSGKMEEGVVDGTRAIMQQLSLPDDEAKAAVAAAAPARQEAGGSGGPPLIFILFILFWVLGGVFGLFGRRQRRSGGLWWLLPLILSNSSRGGGGWSGGGSSGGFGGGGFSGGGGSGGGGGASGSW